MYIRQSNSDNISMQLLKIDINNRHSFKNKILFGNNLKMSMLGGFLFGIFRGFFQFDTATQKTITKWHYHQYPRQSALVSKIFR